MGQPSMTMPGPGQRPCALAIVLLVTVLLLGATPAGAQARGGPGMKGAAPSTAASRKIVSRLRAVLTEMQALAPGREPRAVAEAAARLSSEAVRIDPAGRVQVYVTVVDTTERTLDVLRRHGLLIEIVNAEPALVQGRLPIAELEPLAAEPVVLKIRPPSYASPNVGPITTQGDAVLRCDQTRALGLTGAGVKIGAISTGAGGLADAQAAGELGPVEVLSTSGEDEGTAINHRMAAADTLMVSSAGNRALAHYQGMF